MGCVKPDGVGFIAIDADKDYSTSGIVIVSVTDVKSFLLINVDRWVVSEVSAIIDHAHKP